MPTLYDEYAKDSLFTMMKGEPGTRKSTCALSYPTPQFWFSWDRKMNGLLLPAKQWGMNPTDINYIDLKDWNTAEVKMRALQTNCNYKTIIIDSITSLGDSVMDQAKRLKSGGTRKSGGAAGKKVAGIEV